MASAAQKHMLYECIKIRTYNVFSVTTIRVAIQVFFSPAVVKGEQVKNDRQRLLKDAQLVKTRVLQRLFYVMYSVSDIWSRIGLRLNVFLQTQGRAIVWFQQLGNVFCICVYVKAPRAALISMLADSEKKEWLSRNLLT